MIGAGYALLLGNAWEAQSQDGLLCEVLHWFGENEKKPTTIRTAGDTNNFRKEIRCTFALGKHSSWLE